MYIVLIFQTITSSSDEITCKELRIKDDILAGGTSDREGVAHDAPLRLAPDGHDLADVVNEASHLEPLLVWVLLTDTCNIGGFQMI